MGHPLPDRQLAIAYLDTARDPAPLLEHARRLRDEGRGRTITFSPKVFIPLTTLCRDTCTYCTFAKPPGAGGEYLTPDDVMAIAGAGDAAGCREALLTLGDRPEERWPQAREFLASQGHSTTIGYVAAMSEQIVRGTGLFPHANPGYMTAREMTALRPSNVSMGMMLENISPRLMEPGMPHYDCPDKDPVLRMATIEAAGTLRIPFTTGILVGIGETNTEIVDSLMALGEVHSRLGHIQEVIGPELPGQGRHPDAPVRGADTRLVRPGGSRGPMDSRPGDEPPGTSQPDRAIRDLPRCRNQRLGGCVTTHDRLGEP